MKVIVLGSGGVDSTTCVAMAVKEYGAENVVIASLHYGQKHDIELECARKIAKFYSVRHIEDDISSVMKYAKNVCALMTGGADISPTSYTEQQATSGVCRVNTYVPFRNGLMLSVAASYADSLFPNEPVDIYYGAHADDARGNAYADCSVEFVKAMDNAISIGTYGLIHVKAPLMNMTKADVVKLGLSLSVPYELTYSCYNGQEKPCGVCASCRTRREAFRLNGVEDPVVYQE